MDKNLILKTLAVGPLEANCYILAASSPGPALVIDPGGDETRIAAVLKDLGLAPAALVLTHGHLDHLGAAAALKRSTGAPLAVHRRDAGLLTGSALGFFLPGLAAPAVSPDRLLDDGDTLEAGGLQLQVLYTPGHSPGSICLFLPRSGSPGIVFTGDTLFAGGVGRTDFPGGSYEELIRSISSRLLAFPDETVVYPGHGPATTIGEEKKGNPFLN